MAMTITKTIITTTVIVKIFILIKMIMRIKFGNSMKI